jgi:hypothetical protein
MRARVSLSLAICLLLASTVGNAGSVTGTVSEVIARASDGLTYVYMNGTSSGRPACAANTSYWMIMSESSDVGKKQYAMLLAAKAGGIQLTIQGNNTCSRWADGEDISYIIFGP